ncbi:MAG: class I SAM-dependent methyltransferase [Ginsengibacter sp.]
MDDYTSITKNNLEERFGMTTDGIYHAHQPIYGYRTTKGSASGISRYMITRSILNAVNGYNFNTFIDIGGAEGYTANLVREIFHAQVKSTDLSENACKMAKAIFNIDAIPADIHNLPFSDSEFDIVLCSETLEHVTDYKRAIVELLRITKNVLIITVPHESQKIVDQNIKSKIPHAHIHYFDVNTLDYLKEMGYILKYEKTQSPLLIVPRVIAEGYKKPDTKLHFKIYNFFTPLFRKLFGIGTANWFTNIDSKMTKTFGFYQGITFIIEKNDKVNKKKGEPVKAEDFTGIKVNEYRVQSPVK